jgi:hypothetical protein
MSLRLKVCVVAALATPWLAIPSLAAATPMTPGAASAPAVAQDSRAPDGTAAACGPAAPGFARCFALIRTNVHAGLGVRGRAARAAGGTEAADSLPPGYGPADLQAAYHLSATGGGGQVIAIVDAFDDPTAEADLAVYRQTYGLPACTTANGCFSKVNQAGVPGSYPSPDGGWAAEISLDLDMVSAACPQCHILLVEGNSPAVSDLAASVDTAVALGANVVSNSYGTSEGNGMQQFFPNYQHAGRVIVASSGDFGYTTAQFPAVTPGVLAVGGTSLSRAGNRRGWTETAWGHGASSGFLGGSGSGSGCSAYVDKSAWQHDKYCHMRTIADVSADADPQTGVAVYDTTPSQFGPPGWLVIGGTSASAPFVSGVIGQAGNSATFTPGYAYAHAASFFDVTKGSNGYCGKDYLCTAKSGYDGPVQPTTASGSGDTATGSFQLSRNGAVLATGSYAANGPFEDQIPVPHAAAQYQLDYDVTRSAPWWTLSTATHTQWTFKSGPSTAELPPGWFCDGSGAAQCNVLPLLFARYQLPTDDTGHEPAGPVTGEVDISHLQGAANTAITGFTMQVSFDGGQTWQPAATTTIAPGRYQVGYTNPSGASAADIQVTARDAQGNTLSQVIHQAYAITAN